MTSEARDATNAAGGGGVARALGRRPTLLHLVLLSLAVAACYGQTLRFPFHFDDEASVSRELAWVASPGPATRRIAYLSLRANHWLGGADPSGYRVVNTGIHLLAGIALYVLGRLLLSSASHRRSRDEAGMDPVRYGWVSLAAALLFVVHPVQTQAVTYVIQRLSSLAALFYLSALALYATARDGRFGRPARAGAYAGALASAALGMWTKEIVFTLPLAIVLLELTFGGRPAGMAAGSGRDRASLRLLAVAPFVALLAAIPATLSVDWGGGAAGIAAATRADSTLSRVEYLATQARVILTYLRLLLVPVGQAVDHDYAVERSLFAPAVVVCGLVVLGLLALGILLVRRHAPGPRVAGFGILLFFLGLAVESTVPIADVMVEHRLYLPSAGLALALAGVLLAALTRWPTSRRFVIPAVAAWAVALALATVARNDVWRDPVSLWTDAAAKSPAKARVHYNLGYELLYTGDLARAERALLQASSLDPADPSTMNALGLVAMERKDWRTAEAHLRTATQVSPFWAVAWFNLGLVLERQGRFGEARGAYRRFVELDPPAGRSQAERLRRRFGW